MRSLAAVLILAVLPLATLAHAGGEKVAIDKLPKNVVDAVKAKFPTAVMKHATKETEGGKTTFEIGMNVGKDHLHAVVTGEGKLIEIHQEIDIKDVPEKVAVAVKAKYAKAKWEGVEKMSDGDGKVFAYEVELEVGPGTIMIVMISPDGKITKETKLDPKKNAK